MLLESANFNPVNIRGTSTALGLRTEASIRFEKGLHPELAVAAVRRAMALLVEVAGGRAAKGVVDAYPRKRKDTRVEVTRERIQQVLGIDVATAQVRTALTDLGFGCRWVPPDRYVVRAPYWRTDVNIAGRSDRGDGAGDGLRPHRTAGVGGRDTSADERAGARACASG